MKKFASIMIAMLLVMSTVVCGMSSASAAVGIDFNQTGAIVLEKGDSTEGGLVSGATFTAYQVLDLVADGDNADAGTYTVNTAFGAAGDKLKEMLTGTGNSTSTGGLYTDTEAVEALCGELEDEINNGVATPTGTDSVERGTTGVYDIKGLDLGVYLVLETVVPDNYVVSTSSFLVTVPEWDNDGNAWNYTVTAQPKDDPLDVDKTVQTSAGDYKEEAQYQVGSTINFKVEAKVPNYGYSVQDSTKKVTETITAAQFDALNLQFVDTFSTGLTYNNDIAITVDGTAITMGDTLKSHDVATGADYKVTTAGQVVTVDVSWATLDAYQGKTIVLTYSATLNDKAVVGVDGNPNDIKYNFTNDPKKGTKDVTEDTVKVYTYQMDLEKTFEGKAPTGTIATEVEFKLLDSQKTALKVVDLGNGLYSIYDGTNGTALDTFKPNAEGKVSVKGLAAGTYYLEETKSAEGYSKLPTLIQVDIIANEADGKHLEIASAKHYEYENEAATAKDLTVNGYTFSISVNNVKKQFTLPTTGGVGLWIFTLAGGVVMAAAIIFFASVRRKKDSK